MLTTVQNDLQRATPESQGIPSSAILQFVEAAERQIHEFHSFMLLRHGKVVAEGWWSPYERDHIHSLFSLSKSFTSTAVGLAVEEGHFSIDDPVLSFFPDEAPAEVNEHLAAMRVRHLLSMTTGQVDDTMPVMIGRADWNWEKGFFDVPVLHEPGTYFLYNTGATYMLSAILQRVTGMKLMDYLKPRLFEPLGITKAIWQESPSGVNVGGFGLSITLEDVARFGQLYLQKGMWGDLQLVPKAWVEEATSKQAYNGDDPQNDWNQGYGYQFWRCRHNAYRGDGAFGQYCIVMPEQDAVLAIFSGLGDMQEPLNLVWDILLPAMGADALPDDPTAHDRLTNKLSSLCISPVQGAASSPTVEKVSGRTYEAAANELKIETITLDGDESGYTFRITTPAGEEKIPCGYGSWLAGETKLFNEPWEVEPEPIVSSGAWTDDHTFTMVIRFYETPFYQTFLCHFDGDQMRIETRINVGFVPPETKVIEARLA